MKTILTTFLMLVLSSLASQSADLDAPGEKKVTLRTEIERGASAVRLLRPRVPDERVSIDALYRALKDLLAHNKQQNTDSDGFLLGAHLAFWAEMVDLCDIPEAEWKKIPPDERLQRQAVGLPRGWGSFDDVFMPLQTKLGLDDATLCKLTGLDPEYYGDKIAVRKRIHQEYDAKKRAAKKWTLEGKVLSKDAPRRRLLVQARVTSGGELLLDGVSHLGSHPDFKSLSVGSPIKCLVTEFSSIESPDGKKTPFLLFSP